MFPFQKYFNDYGFKIMDSRFKIQDDQFLERYNLALWE